MGSKRDMEMSVLCDRCTGCESEDDKTLYDLAHMDDKSMSFCTLKFHDMM